MQNGFVESFNGRMRDELLKESLFFGLSHTLGSVTPTLSLQCGSPTTTPSVHIQRGYQTPHAFAATLVPTRTNATSPTALKATGKSNLRRGHIG